MAQLPKTLDHTQPPPHPPISPTNHHPAQPLSTLNLPSPPPNISPPQRQTYPPKPTYPPTHRHSGISSLVLLPMVTANAQIPEFRPFGLKSRAISILSVKTLDSQPLIDLHLPFQSVIPNIVKKSSVIVFLSENKRE